MEKKMFISDSFFTGGIGHQVCQDFVISGEYNLDNDGFQYAIICDGCSQSKNSDVGARILSFITLKYLKTKLFSEIGENEAKLIEEHVIDSSKLSITFLELPIESLYSTLLILYKSKKSNYFYTIFYGDGFAFYKGKNEDVKMIYKIKYEKEAPYYPVYNLCEKYKKEYEHTFSNTKYIEFPSGHVEKVEISSPVILKFDANNIDLVGIASDGFDQMFSIDEHGVKESINYETALKGSLGIKNFVGQYLNRHLHFLSKRKWPKKIELFDDISIATIANIVE